MVGGIELLDSTNLLSGLRYPFKFEKVTQIVITAGGLSCIVDFRSYTLKAPAMAIFLPGQVVESLVTDEEFEGLGMMITPEFTDSLNLPVSLQERLFLQHTQFHTISQEAIDAYLACYRQVAGILKQDDNPNQEQIVKHLFSAYYYGLGYYVHSVTSTAEAMTPQQNMCERFIGLVAEHFKQHRDLDFYADKLCISKKYLSTLLKEHTGMTAFMWIEQYVVLYAKSSLSSTKMTIQQVSDELNFPSQSVFGKYFKRVEGISPKAYRESLR